MKKTLENVLLLVLALALCLSLCACGGTSESTPETKEAEGVDFSIYPESFDDWNIAYLKSYLRETGVMAHDDWTFDMSAGDLDTIGAEGGVIYMDMNGGTVLDMIFHFDPQTGEAMLNTVRETRELTPDVEGATGTAMDAMLGSFCFSYTMGADAEHNAALCQAIRDLADHFGITPDFITE